MTLNQESLCFALEVTLNSIYIHRGSESSSTESAILRRMFLQ